MHYPHRRTRPRAVLTLATLLIAVAPLTATAQAPAPAPPATQPTTPPHELIAKEEFILPPAEIERLVTAPWHLNARLSQPSPDRKLLMRVIDGGLPAVAALAKPFSNLAGLQVDTRANRDRRLTVRAATGLEIVDAATGHTRAIETPKGATLTNPRWSPDGSRIAFIANFDDASYAYVADARTGKSRAVSRTPLLATLVTTLQWTGDGKRLALVLIPDGRKPAPTRPAVVAGPKVQLSTGAKNRNRTYASLLEDDFDKQVLEYYATGQLALADVNGGAVRKVGAPEMIHSVDAAPLGDYFRVRLVRKPFSYMVQLPSFAQVEQLWDASGKVLAELSQRRLREGQDSSFRGGAGAAADSGRRAVAWHPSGVGLTYLERARGASGARVAGDGAAADSSANRGAQRRKDRLHHWLPPFHADSARVLHESDNAMTSALFSEDGRTIFVTENVGGGTHTYAVKLDDPKKRHTVIRANRPATAADSAAADTARVALLLKDVADGSDGRVVRLSSDGRYAYLERGSGGRQAAALDPSARSFIDRVEIASGARTRVYEAPGDFTETVAAVLDDDIARLVVQRESRTAVPDYYLRDVRDGALTKLTSNKDHAPEITNAQRKRIQVTRADGFKLWVNITLPRDYAAGTRLPALFWFYPYEFTDQKAYDRRNRETTPDRFPSTSPRSMEYLVTQGYAVVQPDAPIVGPSGRMNDNYVHDLRNNLAAVIDELDRLGYIDRQRLGLGGHSYGAFSTVNAMVHTPFFKAGIAGDGNYNRTLTPNGFQSERRDLWEGRETYLDMSPFLYANRLTGALLMYHGVEDQNVGTDPTNSTRLMHALQGMGKTAALYMYAYEDHGPVARETLLDMWARWTTWLDLYVKNAGREQGVHASAADDVTSTRP